MFKKLLIVQIFLLVFIRSPEDFRHKNTNSFQRHIEWLGNFFVKGVHEPEGPSHFVGSHDELVEHVRLLVEETNDGHLCAFHVAGDAWNMITHLTRQVYNLLQDLWNKFLGFCCWWCLKHDFTFENCYNVSLLTRTWCMQRERHKTEILKGLQPGLVHKHIVLMNTVVKGEKHQIQKTQTLTTNTNWKLESCDPQRLFGSFV